MRQGGADRGLSQLIRALLVFVGVGPYLGWGGVGGGSQGRGVPVSRCRSTGVGWGGGGG